MTEQNSEHHRWALFVTYIDIVLSESGSTRDNYREAVVELGKVFKTALEGREVRWSSELLLNKEEEAKVRVYQRINRLSGISQRPDSDLDLIVRVFDKLKNGTPLSDGERERMIGILSYMKEYASSHIPPLYL